jgi:hypothetical protein
MLENKIVIVDEFQGKEKAMEIVNASILRYRDNYRRE